MGLQHIYCQLDYHQKTHHFLRNSWPISSNHEACMVLLNWNGKALPERFLPAVVAHSKEAELWVIDNASDGQLFAPFLTNTIRKSNRSYWMNTVLPKAGNED